jgi:phage-related protein
MSGSLKPHREKPLHWVASAKKDLLAFPDQKKSPSGLRTARADVQTIRRRLIAARADSEARYGKKT